MWNPTLGGVCPYLGRCDDPENFYAYPTAANCCHAEQTASPVAVSYQAETCFSASYKSCPRYKAAQDGTAPPTPTPSNSPGRTFLARLRSARLVVLIAVGVLILLAIVLFLILGPDMPAVRIPALASNASATRTATATQAPSETPAATSVPATDTPSVEPTGTQTPTATPTTASTATPTPRPSLTASPSPTPTATRTALPTSIATPSRTPTDSPSPTPSATATPQPTATSPRPQATRRPTATSTPLPAPVLLSPADDSPFDQWAEITLAWQPVGVLPRDAYYVVSVAYSHQGDTWHDDTPWIKTTSWTLSDHRYLLDLSDDGLFRWSVQVFRQTRVDAEGKPVGVPLSAPSEVRTILWRDSSPGGGPSTPTPPPP
jgi:hypothetical protein